MKRLFRICSCTLLCLLVLTGVAFADLGPKPSVTIWVVNAPEGVYYLDLLTTRPGDNCWFDPEGHDAALLEGLRAWEGEGWYPALSGGTPVPMSGSLTPDEKGNFRFGYFGLPDTFRIAVSGPDGAKATAEPFIRTRFFTHLTYDYEANTIAYGLDEPGFYLVQLLGTLVPTLVVEGVLLYLFGFRKRRSWLVFLAANLVTQAGLHLFAATSLVIAGSGGVYSYLRLLPAEPVILLVEGLAYGFLIKEEKMGRRFAYALCANAASYAVGYLPLHWLIRWLRY